MADNQTSTSNAGGTGTTTTDATGTTGTQRTDATQTTGTTQTSATQGTTQTTDKGTATALSSTADTTQVTSPADWPADWRDKLAAGDEKLKARLGRFASPADILKSYTQLETRLSSGQFKSVLPADAKPEDVTRWRQENGIPEKAEGYLEKLDKGVAESAEDKALIAPFLAAMLEKNAPPEIVNAALSSWTKIREGIITKQAEDDETYKAAFEDEMRPEWGTDYRRNINVINGWLDTAPPETRAAILNARLLNGKPLASDKGVLSFLLTAALQSNPAATVAPGSPGASAATIDTEIAGIEKTMREKRSEYDRDTKMQGRYLELLRAREALKGRAAA
jgi:hypothetical protein